MEEALPGAKEASYRLLGLQALVHDDGVILKRGTLRIFLEGRETAELVDLLVERLIGGRSFELSRLKAEIPGEQREPLEELVATLKAHRFIVPADEPEMSSRNREEVFFWNYKTNFAAVVGELAEVPLTVIGVNAIGLALLGNLRGCGFRDITVVDHPALRNLDYYDAKRKLRPEIAGALPFTPQDLDIWLGETPVPGGCFVLCSDFGGRPIVRDFNRFAVERGVMLYPIVLLDHVVHLGPMILPGEGPCYECLWARQNANLADAELIRVGEGGSELGQHSIGYLQPMARAAADFAAIDLLKIFSAPLPGGKIGRIAEIDLMGPAIETHDLLRVPRCPVCAGVQPRPRAETVAPEDAAKPETEAPEAYAPAESEAKPVEEKPQPAAPVPEGVV